MGHHLVAITKHQPAAWASSPSESLASVGVNHPRFAKTHHLPTLEPLGTTWNQALRGPLVPQRLGRCTTSELDTLLVRRFRPFVFPQKINHFGRLPNSDLVIWGFPILDPSSIVESFGKGSSCAANRARQVLSSKSRPSSDKKGTRRWTDLCTKPGFLNFFFDWTKGSTRFFQRHVPYSRLTPFNCNLSRPIHSPQHIQWPFHRFQDGAFKFDPNFW